MNKITVTCVKKKYRELTVGKDYDIIKMSGDYKELLLTNDAGWAYNYDSNEFLFVYKGKNYYDYESALIAKRDDEDGLK